MHPDFQKCQLYLLKHGKNLPPNVQFLERWELDLGKGKYILCRNESPNRRREWYMFIEPAGDFVDIWDEDEAVGFYYRRLYEIALERPLIRVIKH